MTERWTEDRLDSCKAIVEFITRDYGERTDAVRRGLLEDLLFKASGIQTHDKAAFLAQGMYYSLPIELRERFSSAFLGLGELKTLPVKKPKDVGIITVLKVELDAALEAFGSVYDASIDLDGFKYWFCELERSNGSPLSLVISYVGEARNVPCAIAVDHMLSRFSLGLMMLIGIAAGPREKVTIGDVIIADRVYDYEHVRAEIREGQKVERQRPLYVETPRFVKENLNAFDELEAKAQLNSILQRIGFARLPTQELAPVFHRGTLAAGERLIADGSLQEMRGIDERIRGGDQEDSGFAQACEFTRIPWCIFRGISDYGDPTKNEGWHFAAAIAAAAAGFSFLRRTYQPRSL